MTTPDTDPTRKLKIPPNCKWFRTYGDDKAIAFGSPDTHPGCFDGLSILEDHDRELAVCVALQYWRMELERLDEIYGRDSQGRAKGQEQDDAIGQISYWTYFGGFA